MRFDGDSSNNVITGTTGADVIYGYEGNDTLDGGAGDDTIDAGAGDDTIYDGAGSDTVNGGTGYDWIVASVGAGADRFDGGSEIDYWSEASDVVDYKLALAAISVDLSAGIAKSVAANDAAGIGVDELVNIEDVVGSAFDDKMIGSSGANFLSGMGGNDTLSGAGGDDILNGGNGDDLLSGGAGIDAAEYWGASTGVRVSLAITTAQATGAGSDTLTSIEGLYGSSFNDVLTGNDLDNSLRGYSGDDRLIGGAGNDYLSGGQGADRLYGGLGNDIYFVSDADVIVENADEGTDLVQASVSFALRENIENLQLTEGSALVGKGNLANNVIDGNSSDNSLYGYAGSDTLNGNVGNDRLYGDIGEDVLNGGDGNDRLDGGAGADRMIGGFGDDIYYVDDAGDVLVEKNFISGDRGIDTVIASVSFTLADELDNLTLVGGDLNGTGNGWNNRLIGTDGANTLYGMAGADRLDGRAGNDLLDGGSGADQMIGGTGDDIYYVNDAFDRVVEGLDAGYDTVRSSMTWTMANNVERLELTGAGNTRGTGNSLANVIKGNGGSNQLLGMDGDDLLSGGDGNDTLDGGTGTDRLYGGLGDDKYVVTDAGDTIVELLDEGIDTVSASVSYTLGANVDRLTLTGSAAIDGTGNDLENIIFGNGAANLLRGGAGMDEIHGNGGDDILDGGTGGDMMDGGNGNDTYIVDSTWDETGYTDPGMDTIISSVSFALDGAQEILQLVGSANINAHGNYGDDTLLGNSGANILNGDSGDDQLFGGAGADRLIGEDGEDMLQGGAGRDVMTGGDATYDGYGGADRFVFDEGEFGGRSYSNCDVITDFWSESGDKVDLSLVDAVSATAGDEAFSFIGTASFSGVAGELRYFQATVDGVASTYIQGDADGDGVSDFLIALTGTMTLSATDFIL